MKKATSVLLILVLFMSMLGSSPVSFAANADTPYSGGSGTEDDPYLISSADDLNELYYNMENDGTLFSKKPCFKLVNDITINSPISPIYSDSLAGFHCFKETDLRIGNIIDLIYLWDDHIIDSYIYSEEINALFTEKIWNVMGPAYYRINYYSRDLQTYLSSEFTGGCTVGTNALSMDYKYATSSPVLDSYNGIYRAVAFTGVFDGNGHTITADNTYLFGFLKNGAVIKNLNIAGDFASLAYELDDTCTISDCTFRANGVYTFEYESKGRGHDSDLDIPIVEYTTVSYENIIVRNKGTLERFAVLTDHGASAIGNNNGTIKDYMAYGTSTSPSSFWKNFTNCVDFSNASVEESENIYTLEECIAAGGDPSAYAGFDFEKVWIMKDGLPYLRTALERGTGDFDVNGAVNSVDTNLLRRYLSGSILNPEFIHPDGADMDNNGEVNAADSALLRRTLVG